MWSPSTMYGFESRYLLHKGRLSVSVPPFSFQHQMFDIKYHHLRCRRARLHGWSPHIDKTRLINRSLIKHQGSGLDKTLIEGN